tara:strand:- start:220 stop:1062 length:843 start_codon:yes stop_codon:yes gene_type:complete
MHCIYINLDSAVDRREAIEENFRETMAPHGFALHRLPAVTINDVLQKKIEGSQTDSAKACYLSHVAALEKSLEFSGPVMILEDDACFGRRTGEKLIEVMGKIISSDFAWDIFFTDVIFGEFSQMADLMWDNKIFQRRERQVFKIFDLKGWTFCGMSAYIVHPNAKNKIMETLNGQVMLNHLNDIYIRDKVQEGALKALTIFPFLTSVSDHAGESQVQSDEFEVAIRVINGFRKLCWNDVEVESLDPEDLVKGLDDDFFDTESEYFAQITRLMASRKFKLI